MEHDQEVLDTFAVELTQIVAQLKSVADEIRADHTAGNRYEQFGQIIDRVFGTAATLGYVEIADYCGAMKNLTYKCSQSDDNYAQNQVKEMVFVAVQLMERIQANLHAPFQLKKIHYTMNKEREKAEDLSQNLLGAITRTSTAA